jgi:purine-nucleoside phosphorylase
MTDYFNKVLTAKAFLSARGATGGKWGLVLGSGLGGAIPLTKRKLSIDYRDIPNMPVSAVAGHEGKLIFGETESGSSIYILSGRVNAQLAALLGEILKAA